MLDYLVPHALPVLATLGAFLVGAAGWFATNFWGRPILKFFELRALAHEAVTFHGNVGDFPGESEKVSRAMDELRRLAAQISGIAATGPPVMLRVLQGRRYDLA